jgi:hypothetical protein
MPTRWPAVSGPALLRPLCKPIPKTYDGCGLGFSAIDAAPPYHVPGPKDEKTCPGRPPTKGGGTPNPRNSSSPQRRTLFPHQQNGLKLPKQSDAAPAFGSRGSSRQACRQ